MKSPAIVFPPISMVLHLRPRTRPTQSARAEISQVDSRRSFVSVKFANSQAPGDAAFLPASVMRWDRIRDAVGVVFSRSDLRGWRVPSPDQLEGFELEVFEHDSELDATTYSVIVDIRSQRAELSVGVPEHSRTGFDLPKHFLQGDTPTLVKAVLLELKKADR